MAQWCNDAPTTVTLNIPQLALAKLALTGEYQTEMEEVLSSISTGGNLFFAEFILLSSTQAMNANVSNFVHLEKSLVHRLVHNN